MPLLISMRLSSLNCLLATEFMVAFDSLLLFESFDAEVRLEDFSMIFLFFLDRNLSLSI